MAEGLSDLNQLRRHKAKVKTYCDGFACSAASVVFMAGDERIMSNASLLMIHNAWCYTAGDPNQLRKDAEDLEKITEASINAYMSRLNITEEKLKEMMDAKPDYSGRCLEMGFATSIVDGVSKNASQSVKKQLMSMIIHRQIEQQKAIQNQPEPTPREPEPEPPQENKLSKMLAAIAR